MTFAFHISRAARTRYGVAGELFTLTGNVVGADFAGGRRLAQRMNEHDGRGSDPARAVHGAELNAMGLLDEILHAVIAMYREQINARAIGDALAAVRERVGPDGVSRTLETFVEEFPTAEALRDGTPPTADLAGSTDGVPNTEIALEELLLLWLANMNPALTRYRELFDDAPLVATAPYDDVMRGLVAHFAAQPPWPDGQTLIEMLRAPALAAPDSIAGQLRFVRERWLAIVSRFADRLVTNLDVLAEEERALWQRFHPPGPGGGAEEAALRAGRAWLAESGWYEPGEGEAEPEQFSMDRDWMPRLVLIAKSSFVWLDQLSKQYGRSITRLDEIPDEELDRLARRGFSGLWLIGLWQRSRASQTIKQLRGNPEAVASAYSLDDYRIADDLGGEEAFERLKARAWTRGIRIASDMVPNHMGIDSRWVMEHPDWFLSLPEPPYPAYTFTGPDLSWDPGVGIQIEDHYFDSTDAAVVFRRWDRATGESRYLYHGNDGTTMPWNDTAQLDYLKAEVREAVIRTILDVARRSPVIRFDAAMTLAKRHIERLWYPEPGAGGGIPSRAEHAMPKAEFERLMPLEFWREVVDRVAAEVPDTLLLAEAFWLMESYFVRTLGMHRVYNSAFMNMLRDEENANYRSVMKNTIEFDPEVLKRYVNFMNNPDERTAVDQFGKGDKYFGVATLMATLPGLPMFGHGQVEGFTEKYGMEYRRAYFDEQPDTWLVERHEREIAPLLHRRHLFAEVADFLLFDVVRDDGTVDDDVFAYANRGAGESSLIVYNNRYGTTDGSIRLSVPFSVREDGSEERVTRQRSLADGLRLHRENGWFVAMRDERSGLEYLHASAGIHEHGLRLHLDAYECRVHLAIREVQDGPGRPWRRLATELGERGVPSLDEALRGLVLRPVQEPLARLLVPLRVRRVAAAPRDPAAADARDDVAALIGAARGLLGESWRAEDDAAADVLAVAWADGLRAMVTPERIGAAGFEAPVTAGERASAAEVSTAGERASAAEPAPAAEPSPAAERASAAEPSAAGGDASPLHVPDVLAATWLLLRGLPSALGRGDAPARAWIDDWRLAPVIASAFRDDGMPEADAWRAVEAVKAFLALPAWDLRVPLPERIPSILAAWLADPAVLRVLQVNVHRDVRWFNREAFEAFAGWTGAIETYRAALVTAATTPAGDTTLIGETVAALVDAATSSGYRLDALLAPAPSPAAAASAPSAPSAPAAASGPPATPAARAAPLDAAATTAPAAGTMADPERDDARPG